MSFLLAWLWDVSISTPTALSPTACHFTQEADCLLFIQPVFFVWFRHLRHTLASQGRAGAIINWCAQRLLLLAHRALVLALTARVDLPLPEPGRQALSPSHSFRWATQIWSQRQHLLNRGQWAARATACDMCQLRTQSQTDEVRADELP